LNLENKLNLCKDFYIKNSYKIKELMEYFYQNNNHVILWGAGEKGVLFLELFDSLQKYIDFAVDIDTNKHGVQLNSGHIIKNFEAIRNNDIILIAHDLYYPIQIFLIKNGYRLNNYKFLSIDSYINGEVTLEAIISGKAWERKKYYD